MMKRKIWIAMCCASLLCGLSGCQLAREDEGANAFEDKLIGVYITAKYLDLFDIEGYLNDHVNNLQGGGITIDNNTQKYQGRLYAALTTKTHTNEETGEVTQTEEYVFGGLNGISCIATTVPASGEHGYFTTLSGDGISDTHLNINNSDDADSIALEGTIYSTPSNTEYYFNPVYQSPDGSVYLVSGNGFMVSSETYSEGSIYSQKLDETTTVTENGKTKTYGMTVTISVSVIFPPEKIDLIQMDADNKVLSRVEYQPDALPESLVTQADTAYLIVESYKRDNTGSLKTMREIYDRGAESFASFLIETDGICVKHWTQIEWQ